MTYKYIYIYIYIHKYTKPSNTLTLSRHKRPHKPRTYKQPDKLYKQAQNASRAYMAKCTIRIMPQKPYSRTICTYAAILKNCIMRSVFQFCLCFVTTLKIFCNLFVICRAKWARVCVGKLKIDVIRTYIRPQALAL